jgi:hypothetical protein
MRKPPDVAIFLSLVLLWSLVLSVLASRMPGIPNFSRTNSLIAIPVASVILSARGARWWDKLKYACVVLGVFVAFDYAFVTSGAGAIIVRGEGLTPGVLALGVLYVAMGLAFPVGVLIVFAGRDPSKLWEKQQLPPVRRKKTPRIRRRR